MWEPQAFLHLGEIMDFRAGKYEMAPLLVLIQSLSKEALPLSAKQRKIFWAQSYLKQYTAATHQYFFIALHKPAAYKVQTRQQMDRTISPLRSSPSHTLSRFSWISLLLRLDSDKSTCQYCGTEITELQKFRKTDKPNLPAATRHGQLLPVQTVS